MNTVCVVAGGDVEWSERPRRNPILFEYSQPEVDRWPATPRVRQNLPPAQLVPLLDHSDEHYSKSIKYTLPKMSPQEFADYPFVKIRHLFREADIGFVNLEMPLTAHGRQVGDFKGDPIFANSMNSSGISIVSLANNHALDAEGAGLLSTIETLEQARIDVIGAGCSLSEARQPRILEIGDIRLGFLGYSQIPGEQFGRSFATCARAGIAPLDPSLTCQDVAKLKHKVDHVIVSVHWGREDSPRAHPAARSLAHRIVESGADVILGHHPHVPQEIEIFDRSFIVYSMGNLIFGHNHNHWSDNILVKVIFSKHSIEDFAIIPIAGCGNELSQPFLLEGKRAERTLVAISTESQRLSTTIRISNDTGVPVSIDPKVPI